MHNESQQLDPSFQALPLTLVCFLYYFILQKFDYAIWTGDVPPHNIWNQSRADQVKCIIDHIYRYKNESDCLLQLCCCPYIHFIY